MRTIIASILVLLISYMGTYGNSHELDVCIHIGREVYKEYLINDNTVKVVNGSVLGEEQPPQYSRKLNSDEVKLLTKFIEKCDLRKLKRRNINRDVEDGRSVKYKIKVKGTEFEFYTANVYHPTLISICEKINELLPREHQMGIPSKTAPWILVVDPNKDAEQVIK